MMPKDAVTIDELRRLLGNWSRPRGAAYQLLAGNLARLIEDGAMPSPSRLPSERALADALSVSRRTVEAAYDQLRASGHVASRVGAGTWCTRPGGGTGRPKVALASHIGYFPGQADGLIDMTIASPAAHPLLTEAREATKERVAELQRHSTGYLPEGLPGLREQICGWFRDRGVPTGVEQILVTSGATQALWLAGYLLSPGSDVVVENPGSPSIYTALRTHRHRLLAVQADEDGLTVQAMPGTAPAAVFVTPAYLNPTGAALSRPRAEALAELAAGGTLVVEDLTLADLRLEGPVPTPLCSFGGRVLSIGSMSKLVWGGLRVGWLRAPEPVIRELTRARSAVDLATSLDAQVQSEWLLPRRADVLADRIPLLRAGRNRLSSALADLLPEWRWSIPKGGMSLWAELPAPLAEPLRQLVLRRGVSLLSANEFTALPCEDRHLRLPYVLDGDRIEEAVSQLAHAYRELAARSRTV